MAKNPKLLMLRLEGPFQSWGEFSKWDTRESASMPTKSGVVGLIAGAMGLGRDDPKIDRLNQAVTLAVRADRSGTRMIDYQTVTGDPLRTAEGKKRSNGDTILVQREYLENASFLVVVQAEPEWLEEISRALQSPKWPLFLGRKCCVPTRPVFDGIHEEYASLRDALFRCPAAAGADRVMQCEWEAAPGETGSYTRTDERLPAAAAPDAQALCEQRRFARRRVWHGTVKGAENVPDQN